MTNLDEELAKLISWCAANPRLVTIEHRNRLHRLRWCRADSAQLLQVLEQADTLKGSTIQFGWIIPAPA